jgi:hypothetical protein
VDREMREFIENEADRLGVTPTEFMRRLLEVYQESRAGNAPCDYCGEPVVIELTYT